MRTAHICLDHGFKPRVGQGRRPNRSEIIDQNRRLASLARRNVGGEDGGGIRRCFVLENDNVVCESPEFIVLHSGARVEHAGEFVASESSGSRLNDGLHE